MSTTSLEQLLRYEIVFKSFGGNSRKSQVPIHYLPDCLQLCGLALSSSKIELYSKQMKKQFFTFGDMLDIIQEEELHNEALRSSSTPLHDTPSNLTKEEIDQIIPCLLRTHQGNKIEVTKLKQMLCTGEDGISTTQVLFFCFFSLFYYTTMLLV